MRKRIIIESDQRMLSELAGKELRRYLYLLKEGLIDVETADGPVSPLKPGDRCIIAAPYESSLLSGWRDRLPCVSGDSFGIKSVQQDGAYCIVLYGSTDLAVLYAVYSFLEECGFRFYLHDDVLPAETKEGSVFEKKADRVEEPLFQIRGILPFHDFPEGPDWWSRDNYCQILSQLVKMKGNFIGLHTYPENDREPEKMTAEPLVWIGMQEDVEPDGAVTAAYPAQHFKTSGGSWGYRPVKTADYLFGLGRLFGTETVLPDYMQGYEEGQYQEILRKSRAGYGEELSGEYVPMFNRSAAFFAEVLGYAHELQVKSCIGTETPLTVPETQRRRYRLSKELSEEEKTALYEGIFKRINQKYPIDYYWFWTPEDWTWKGNTPEETQRTIEDITCALRARERTKSAFLPALCGWTLGPVEDRTLFDRYFPKSMPFSCINRFVGFEPVETQFEMLQARPAWAIPWLEDDPALTAPQLWAGRVRKDAYDAKRYGCEGLIGIHWRTETISPTIRALMDAGWHQKPWADGLGHASRAAGQTQALAGGIEDFRERQTQDRYAPCEDLYEDWAGAQFGPKAGAKIARILAEVDGMLPRPARWEDGPGNLIVNEESWEQVRKQYAFLDRLKALREEVTDADCLERFDSWIARFSYLKAMSRTGCQKAAFDRAAAEAADSVRAAGEKHSDAADRTEKRTALQNAAEELAEAAKEMVSCLIDSIQTMGDLGTAVNLASRTLPQMERDCREKLKYCGLAVPDFHSAADVRERIVLLSVRTRLKRKEKWNVRVLVMGGAGDDVVMHIRTLMDRVERLIKLECVNGSWLYEAELDAALIGDDFSYYVETKTETGTCLSYPVKGRYPERTVIVAG